MLSTLSSKHHEAQQSNPYQTRYYNEDSGTSSNSEEEQDKLESTSSIQSQP